MKRPGLLRLGVAAALVGAGAAGWWASGRDAAIGPRPDSVPAADVAASSAVPALPAVQVAARPPAPPQPAASSGGPARAAPAFWDLCGIGRVPVPAGDGAGELRELPPHLGALPAAEARGRLMAALRQGDARARAAERYLNPPEHDPRNAGEVDAIAAEIAELAGQDAAALRWAAARCASPSCRESLLARWVAVDPGNAVPRLGRMQAGEPDEELLRALRAAGRFKVYWGVLTETVRRALPAELPPYLGMPLLAESIGVEAAMQDDSPHAASARLCRLPLPEGSERREVCAALGLLMTEKADTAVAHLVGIRIRERAGFDAVQAEAMRRRLNSALTLPFDGEQPYSCASVQSTGRWVETVARDGETATLLARAASSPRPAR